MAKFVRIQNIQSTSNLGTSITPEYLSLHLPPTTTLYNPSLPHKLYYFATEPKTRFTIFRKGGTLVVLGGKSTADASTAVQQLVTHLHGIGMDRVRYTEPQINNISASFYLGFKVHLPNFANDPRYEEVSIYMTETYPGLRFKGLATEANRSITATIFHSGKGIITGAKHEEEVIEGYDKLLNITELFKILNSNTDGDDKHVYTNVQDVDMFYRYMETGSLYIFQPLA